MKLVFVCAALAVLGACATAEAQQVADPRAGVIAGPETSPELAAAIQARDAELFAAMFDTCDIGAVTGMVAENFEFIHDKWGRTNGAAFLSNMRNDCAARESGQNVRASREIVPGSVTIYAVQQNGAIEIGEHRFYGLAPDQPPHLRETGRFFIQWVQEDGVWKMSRAYSYDHRPAQ